MRKSSGSLVCVPVHAGVIVDMKTLKSILEQAELTINELIELL
ncbi:hypothetical protein DOT_2114 [Desulfosporosinus sp. OT]|nr:hypothetical protein DOT_2114 [Desulfosporosinus sp. OT]